MAKNIVFCADGTWNGPGSGDESQEISEATNVLKTFLNVAGSRSILTAPLADEEESSFRDPGGNLLQITKYIHGVGDSDNFISKILGGTLGAGLVARIVRGYTFISRNYCAGDQIYIIGFSRGAYTARALGGLIASQGLIDATKVDLESDKSVAYRWGSAVWYAWRQHVMAGDDDRLGQLEELALDLPGFLLSPPPDEQMLKDVPIAAIGVWDTVGALGIPEFNTQDDNRIQALRFADDCLSPKVQRGFHAVSIDERRADFTPTLWAPRDGIEQRLFPGAHADVGGGYPTGLESGLSDGAMAWMVNRLTSVGVRFDTSPTYVPKPDPTGIAHAPWLSAPWNSLPRITRKFPDTLVKQFEDPSVDARRRAGPVKDDPSLQASPYLPENA